MSSHVKWILVPVQIAIRDDGESAAYLGDPLMGQRLAQLAEAQGGGYDREAVVREALRLAIGRLVLFAGLP